MKWHKLGCLFGTILVTASLAQASETIDLPEEELAKESVVPVFDRPVSVKNRNVVTEGRVDMNLFYGLALTEPIFNVSRFGLNLYYNTSENHAFGLIFSKNSSGLSMYAKQLNETPYNLDFARAPGPDSTILLDWNMKMFYGKMSLTKNGVYNLSLYSTLAGGLVKYAHKSYPAVAAGLGQKFYLSRNFALRFDMRLFMHQAPIPFLAASMKTSDPVPSYTQFNERVTYTTMLDAGLSYLF